MNEEVRRLVVDSGPLRSIHGARAGVGFATLAFVFERGTLRLDCDTDTDEVVASADAATSDLPEIANNETLAAPRGKVVEQAWVMTSDRGFADAFQIRFIDLESRAEVSVQVEAAAGALELAAVTGLR